MASSKMIHSLFRSSQLLLKLLFLLSLTCGIAFAAWGISLRLQRLPDLARFFPAEKTEFFFLLRNPTSSHKLLGTPISELSWVKAWGLARVNEQELTLVEVHSTQLATVFLKRLLLPEEQMQKTRPTTSLWSSIFCYSMQSLCFTWLDGVLVLAESVEPLEDLQKTAAGEEISLRRDARYLNVRSRLTPAMTGAFYVNLQKLLLRLNTDFSLLSSFMQIFPAWGGAMTETKLESFLAVDKMRLGDEPYWHPLGKYEGRFLKWTPSDLAVEWGGRDLGLQWEHLLNLTQKLNPSLQEAMKDELRHFLQKTLGVSDFTSFQVLLDGEQYFGFTPATNPSQLSQFLLLTELNNDGEVQKALMFKEQFAKNYFYPETYALDSGEVRIRFLPLTQSTGTYNGYQYYTFSAEGASPAKEVVTLIFTENLAIITRSKALAFDTVDKLKGEKEPRSLQELSPLLEGADELFSVHCHLLPNGSILSALLSDCQDLQSTRKLFDDGVFTRSLLHLSHD